MSTSTLSAIPLTTIFTPPASCSPTSVIWGLTGFNSTLYLDREQYSVETKTDCFPSGYSTGSFFSPAPSICPVGYTIACQSVDGSETAAVCCTSNWICAPSQAWYFWTWTYPCSTYLTKGAVYTGLLLWGGDQSAAFATTTLPSGVEGWAYGISIRWQSSDIYPAARPTSASASTSRTSTNVHTATSTMLQNTTGFSASTQPSSNMSLKIGLGVGLSIGVLVIAAFFAILYLRRYTNRRRKSPQDGSPDDGHEDGRYTSDKIVSDGANDSPLGPIQHVELETQAFHIPEVHHAVSSELPEIDFNLRAEQHTPAAFRHSVGELPELESHPHAERRSPVTFSHTAAELPSAMSSIPRTSNNVPQVPQQCNDSLTTTQIDSLVPSSNANFDLLHTQLRRIEDRRRLLDERRQLNEEYERLMQEEERVLSLLRECERGRIPSAEAP